MQEPKSSTSSARIPQAGDRAEQKTATHTSTMPRHASNVRSWMLDEIRPSVIAEIELLLLTFCTGIQDAISFPDYHCFASNQTGNTVLLMLVLVCPQFNGELLVPANVGTALGLFLAGGWITGQLGHIVGARLRIWLLFCNLFQTALVFAAAAVQYRFGVIEDGPSAVGAVALLAFASGSQVVQSRSLAMTEISTAMATAAWVDLMIDPKLFTVKNRSRNRRAAFLIALALGALVGAGIYRTAGSATAILVSACGKLLATFMFLFNEAEKPLTHDIEKASTDEEISGPGVLSSVHQ